MVYCFCFLKGPNERLQREIERAQIEGEFIYYDEDKDIFLDMNNQEVSVSSLDIIPISGIFQLPKMIEALSKNGALIPNSYQQILEIFNWYQYVETNRDIIPFKGKDLEDKAFLTYLIELFHHQDEVFLKTVNKDFHGIVKLSDLIDEDSQLRRTFSYHQDDSFILSNKVNVDSDDKSKLEYRAFILNNRIMNISRTTEKFYHTIPSEVLEYYNQVLANLDEDFPYSYVLDVFSHDGELDILEFNPIECSGKFLYNTIFQYSDDLLHQEIENIPMEKKYYNPRYGSFENLNPSTSTNVSNSFAKDYQDIKMFGKRFDGYVHFYGDVPEGCKIDLEAFEGVISDDDLFSKNSSIDSDKSLKSAAFQLRKK